MSKTRRHSSDSFDELDLFADTEFDLEAFIDSMEGDGRRQRAIGACDPRRPAWQRLEEYREARALKDQLNDWEDWELDS